MIGIGFRTLLSAAALGVAAVSALPATADGTRPRDTPLADLGAIEQVVGAQTGWQSGADGHGIDVAVVDTGVTPVAGLSGPTKLVIGPDLSFDSQDPAVANLDGYGHGTAMAGIIAGNTTGYQGVAPQSRIVSVKVGSSTGAADVSQMIAGIDWVVQHAHDPGPDGQPMNIRVLNLSIGTDSEQAYKLDPLAHAAEQAWLHGIVVVVSVGNDGRSTDSVADPAMDPYLLAVGADDPRGTVDPSDDKAALFSQRGTTKRHADLIAPGTSVPGLLSPGSTLANANPNAIIDGRFLRGSGTSQAAAVTSGVVADLLSARPDLTPDKVKALLMATATAVVSSNPHFVGSGLIQLPAALAAAVPDGSTQTWKKSTGKGSLEAARGNNHVSIGDTSLRGETDVLGQPWNAAQVAQAEENGVTWSGGSFNGVTWSGVTWSGVTWSGVTWSGVTWSGVTWSGVTWSGVTWSGVTWSGVTWSGVTWSGVTWSGVTWSGVTWSGDSWMGATWT